MTPEMRAAMGAAAVRAAEAIGYKGAGTVEFIVDGGGGLSPDGFFFMEMNTRLQVEHPVTEAVTGVDLVEWQLRVAAGEGLPLAQADIPLRGHAFEARLYAEDVPKGFLPATGRLDHLVFAPGARADTGVRAGDTISPHYDPMIAKLITYGPTRAVALAQLARALDETQVAGTVTNLAFLGALARHEGFAAGEVDTGLIGRDLEALTAVASPGPEIWAEAALCAAGLDGEAASDQGFTLWQPLTQTVMLAREGADPVTLRLSPDGPDRVRVAMPEGTVLAERRAGRWHFGDAPARGAVRHGGRVTVFADYGQGFAVIDPLDRAAAAQSADVIEAPMPGRVARVLVGAGDTVAAGDRLAVLEAMKMEHALKAGRDGTIAEVLVAEGDQVEAGAALLRLASDDEAAA